AEGVVGLGVEDGVLVAVGLAGDGAVEAGWLVVGGEEGPASPSSPSPTHPHSRSASPGRTAPPTRPSRHW
ncbi:hypothetical protein ACWF94_27770, partial [Streptomyces sp. NPDC055078]